MKNNWYISFNYPYNDVITTMRILEALDYKSHKILAGIDCYYPFEVPEQARKKFLNEWFEAYLTGIAFLENITEMREFEKTMRGVFLKHYGINQEEINFINENSFSVLKLLCRYTGSNEEILKDPHFAGYKLLKKMSLNDKNKIVLDELKHNFATLTSLQSKIIKTVYTEDKIRFKKTKDRSLRRYISNPADYEENEHVFTWFEINDETELKNITYSCNFNLVITDDLCDADNFIYYIDIVEVNDFALAIYDNTDNFDKLIKNKLLDIRGEEYQFTKFNESLIRYI